MRFVFICVFLFSYEIVCEDISTLPWSNHQLNWGVMFSRVGTMINGIARYRHTFAIPWPKIENANLQQLKCDTDVLYTEDCKRINKFIADVSKRLNGKIEYIRGKLKIEESNMDHARMIINPNTSKFKRDAGSTLGKDYCKKFSSDETEDDTLLGTIGKAASDLFGTPTNDDMKAMANHICNAAKLAELNEKEIHESNDRLTSMSNVINDRITNLKGGITDAERRIELIDDQFKTVVRNTSEEIDSLERRLNKLEGLIAVELELQNGLNKIEQIYDMIEITINQWIFSLRTLTDGKLPPFLVSPEDISNVLTHVQDKILPSYGEQFTLTHQNPLFYYKLVSLLSYAKTENYLMIMLSIPINTIGGLLAVYKIDATHLSVSANDSSSTLITKLPKFFGITSNSRYYIEMDESHFSSCKGDLVKICPSEHSLRRDTQKTCAASIFYDSAADVMEKCDIRFEEIDKMIKSGYSMQIDKLHHFVHSANDEEEWQLICSDPSSHKNIQSVKSCNSCVIKIPCFCSLMTPDYVIPEQLCQIKDVKQKQHQITYKYGINLPMLHSLFDKSDLSQINGNILKENQKWNIHFPELFISNSSSFENVVEEKDDIFIKDFNKVMMHHKNKSEAYATKADYLLKKTEDFSDLSHKHLKYMTNLLGGTWLLSFFRPSTMIGGVSISMIFSIVAIIFCIYTCFMNSKK